MRTLREQILEKWIERMRNNVELDRALVVAFEHAFQGADGAVDRETLLTVVRAAQASR